MAATLLAWLLCLPRNLFKDTVYSTVVESAEGELLGARIAADGQWRFPPCDTVPRRFATALVQFEDRQFWWHPGVNPVAMGRALVQNLRCGHVVSGGSTLTMQVIRLSRNKERTVTQKLIESILATRLELRCRKRTILAMYASHAPFGGNVVGLEAAAWRYFGRPANELSWAEAATLAVLPNAPSTLHLGKGREELLQKRNRLLKRLLEHGDIGADTYAAALEEPLPDAPLPLPALAPHYVERQEKGKRTRTTLRIELQKAVSAVTDRQSDELAKEGVADLAAVVIDNRTGEVVAYVGNASAYRDRPGVQVDIAASPRSTGSILKPFLYEAALQEGIILPHTLLPDIPVNLGGFAPQNFDRQFYGAVPANAALARSLNVPAVFLLRQYGVPKFHSLLQKAGLTTLTQTPDHYGLSLILGGGEGRLDEITAAYSQMAASACAPEAPRAHGGPSQLGRCAPGALYAHGKLAVWYTLDALKEVNRPDEMDWRLVGSLKKVAWKTGTSYGFRDAWAVGVTSDYAVGVWAGNAQGQGVPGLTGARTAGPVMFDIFNMLPVKDEENAYAARGWFKEPAPGEYVWMEVCSSSGHLAGPSCERVDTLMLPQKAIRTAPCPYHKTLDGINTFILPPSMEWYYRQHHPEYDPYIPSNKEDYAPMEFIYPENGSTLYLPRQLDGSVGGITFHLAHRTQDAEVFWHLDDTYVGTTRLIHQMNLAPAPGTHTVTAVDGDGNAVSVRFTVAAGS